MSSAPDTVTITNTEHATGETILTVTTVVHTVFQYARMQYVQRIAAQQKVTIVCRCVTTFSLPHIFSRHTHSSLHHIVKVCST